MSGPTTMRGYNGNLSLLERRVSIERGVKGLLVRKRWSSSRTIQCGEVREVWFQPSGGGRGGWPGFVLLITGTDQPSDDFVARVRDENAVTFLRRSDDWHSFAAAIAQRCQAHLREFTAEDRSGREVVRSAHADRGHD
jgi:hypothetical protein